MLFGLKNALLALLIFAVLYLGSRAPDVVPRLWRFLRYRGSAHWPIQPGIIQEQRRETRGNKRRRRHQAVVTYSYNVNGVWYSGCFRGKPSPSPSDAERLLARYPAHTSVMVRVNPKRAKDSRLVIVE